MTDTAACPPSMPRIGDPAPAFEAETTQGILRLEDFKGSWLVFFSHPADFTPVCTTEFAAFAARRAAFKKLHCELLGLSVDSLFAHIAWVRGIEEKFAVKIDFPVIADLGGAVAGLYGMIQPGESKTEAVRAVFVIDDRQVIRAILYYPMTTGRNIDEILRLVAALQATDAHGVATPADWQPGGKVIVPPPRTQEMAEERLRAPDAACADWFYCEKDLPKP